tara:strand:+ start:398 stop:2050 length:1653 start_codon:yes stop_codon:yes gene_type:complete
MEPFLYIFFAVVLWAFVPPVFIYFFNKIKSDGLAVIYNSRKIIIVNALAIIAIFIIIKFVWIESEPDAASNYSKSLSPSSQTHEIDEIVFWTWEEFGTSSERFLVEAVRLWNESHPTIQVVHQNQSYAGYRDKLKLAIAAGTPPDVAVAGIGDLGSLERDKEMPELSIPIPEEMLTDLELEKYGPMVVNAMTRKGKKWVFPLFKYMSGGFMSANKKLLNEAGYDENVFLNNGWTIEQFRNVAKRLTIDSDGDGTIDIYGFGTPLKNLRELFQNELGPAYWGIEKVKRWRSLFVTYNKSKKQWERDAELTINDFSEPMRTIHQMIYEDKSFGKKYLGMVHNQITKELINKQTLAMTWSGAPQVYVQYAKLHSQDVRNGIIQGKPLQMVVMQSPRYSKVGHPVFMVGATGYSVFKQNPYKGDKHTQNALLFAKYMSSPIMVSYWQYRTRGAFPPPSKITTEIFHNIVDYEDPEWIAYKLFFDSPHAWAPTEEVIFPDNDDRRGISLLWQDWLNQRGFSLLEAIALDQITPENAGREWYENVQKVIDKYYADK